MPSPPEPRKAVSFRIKTDLVARMRRHIRDHAGKPLYLGLASFLESAITREIERTSLIASGALPLEEPVSADVTSDLLAGRRTAIDHANNAPTSPSGCVKR